MAIAPGSTVTLEITKLPTNAAASKTLVRLCAKDPSVQRHQRHQQAKRPSLEWWIRGGKYWHHQMKSRPAVSLKVGAAFKVRATLDVIRDLGSIERFVKVSPAK